MNRLFTIVSRVIPSQTMCMAKRTISTFQPSSKVAPHFNQYLPKVSSYEITKNLSEETKANLFSHGIPEASPAFQRMEVFIMGLQQTIVDHLQNVEANAPAATTVAPASTSINNIPQPVETPPSRFNIERSHRNPTTGMGGGGVVAVLQEGRVFEKAGVNTSVISGVMPLARLHNMRVDHAGLRDLLAKHEADVNSSGATPESNGCPFTAAGISLVLHPHNPHAPTVHANYRMFEVVVGGERVWWFGGGSDLTPTFTSPDDFMPLHFHGLHKATCDELQQAQDGLKIDNLYDHLKGWCDEYFYLPHRNETRGVGGIFFDDMDPETAGWNQEELFKMVMRFGDLFPASYFPLVDATAGKAYTEEEKRFQQLRRGRYVEFNVMIDRGTKFGLQMPNSIRTEQILMSLPLTARYEYKFTPEAGSPEAITQEILQNPIKWV